MGIIPQELIEKNRYWTKALSLVEGCTPVSEACDNCWLAGMSHRFQHEWKDGTPVTENGKFYGQIAIREDRLDIPLKTRKPQVFAVWSDLFHEKVPDTFIEKAYEVMLDAEKHTYLILTKRPERLYQFYDAHRDAVQFFNGIGKIWHGTTVENQEQADKRIPELLKVPGKKFLSVEPMLGEIDIRKYLYPPECQRCCGGECADCGHERRPISQVICGGETGHNARPCHPDWVRRLRDQCAEASVPFFFKKWGSYKGPGDWNIPPGRLLDGRTHDELAWNV